MPAAHSRSIEVLADDEGGRLDTFLARRLGIGRRAAQRLLDRTRVNGHRAVKSTRLCRGDRIEILPDTPAEPPAALDLHRSTARVLVINKPAGLPTLSLAGQEGDTLAERVAAYDAGCRDAGTPLESGLVQRLDTGTSGLILAARDAEAWSELRRQIAAHELQKTYLCIVAGALHDSRTIDTRVGQHRKSRRRMATLTPGTPADRYRTQVAESRIKPLAAVGSGTLVRVATQTGARHQIRVHLASIGHPILGDSVYGGPPLDAAAGHCLHAESIRWRDPEGGRSEFDEVAPPSWWETAAGCELPLAGPAPRH